MRSLPLFPARVESPVDSGGMQPDRSCSRCAWSPGPGRACLPADGSGGSGGLLVVGDSPVKGAVRPFVSKAGTYVRGLVSKYWTGPVVYDSAIKCPARSSRISDAAKPIRECRPYLAEVVRAVRPQRVLSLGSWATMGLLGRSLDMESVRRGYGWVLGDVPVFLAHAPAVAMMNKFTRRRFEEDVRWALEAERPRPSHVGGVVHVVDDEADALAARDYLEDHGELVFDVETAGVPHDRDFTVLCAGLSPVDPGEGDAWVWSGESTRAGRPTRGGLGDPGALAVLQRLLRTKRISGSNVKYDVIAAAQVLGVEIPRIEADTQLLRKLTEPLCKGRLDYAVELVGMGGSKEEAADLRKNAVAALRRKKPRPGDPDREHWCSRAIIAGATPAQYSFGLLPDEVLYKYNGRDVVGSAAVVHRVRSLAERYQAGEMAIYRSLQQRGVTAFARIERAGIRADRQAFETFSAYLKLGVDEEMEYFAKFDGPPGPDGKPGVKFNPGSVDQVRALLFDTLGLPKHGIDVSDSGNLSTDKDSLAKLLGTHPVIEHLVNYRRLEKMDGTYGRGMIRHILSDGCIHPTFRQDGTETLRVSSENPNGQNIPRAETVEGKMARDGFVARPGRILVELDQSQIELRVAAGMSGDPDMIAIFKANLDYHLRTAQLISQIMWRLTPEQVGEFHRQYCKTVNFGLLYGKTDAGLAEQLNITVAEASKLRAAILGTFKKLSDMIKRFLHHGRVHGSIDVPWLVEGAAHTRPLYDIGSEDRWKRSNAENSTTNTPIQGRAALYTIASIPLIHDWIDDNCLADAVDVVNTVHDSVLLDVEEQHFEEVVAAVTGIMEAWDCWGVPLKVDCKAGDRWGTLRKVKRGETLEAARIRWVAAALAKDKT